MGRCEKLMTADGKNLSTVLCGEKYRLVTLEATRTEYTHKDICERVDYAKKMFS